MWVLFGYVILYKGLGDEQSLQHQLSHKNIQTLRPKVKGAVMSFYLNVMALLISYW